MRYYSSQRPIMPGSYPKPLGNSVTAICNYDSKTYCAEIGREVWGYVEYERPLDQKNVIDFELILPTRKVMRMKYIGIDSWGREVFKDASGQYWKYTEPGDAPRERHDRLYDSDELDGEPGWPMESDVDYCIEEGD